jgi:hypothetical protein
MRKYLGKVDCKFVCKRNGFYGYEQAFDESMGCFIDKYGYDIDAPELEQTCLSYEEFETYGNTQNLYGWHISDLVIYDKPRELSDFKTICRNAYCQDDWGKPTWFCKDGYSSCAVIDKEKEFPYNEECIYFDCPSVGGESCEYEDYAYCNCDGLKPITRPFQSWGYVESEENDET